MAGYRIYSFDWPAFAELTSNPESKIAAALAEAIADPQTRKKLRLPAKLPKTVDKLAPLVRELFLQPEWFADRPPAEVKLRNQLLFAMLLDDDLKSIGLAAEPAWREFYECCSFDLGAVLAGRMALDQERIKRGTGAYYKIVQDAEHDGNEFWWFGKRPHRHGGWQASNDEWMEYEEEYDSAVHSIHSPEQVDSLSRELAKLSRACEQIECAELRELVSDYEHCIEGVRQKKAGMFVENDT